MNKRRILTALLVVFALLFSLGAVPGVRAEAGPWQPVSGPYGGSVAALALSPHYAVDHTVFAGLRSQGVYRTTDGGGTWQPVSPDWVVVALAISPDYAVDQTLFAASGLWTSGYRVHRSTDEGASWQDVTPAWAGGPPGTPSLALSPAFTADETVYICTGVRTYISTDGGDSFAQASGWFETHQVSRMAFSPAFASDRTLFALVLETGLFESNDGGATWNPTGLSGDLSAFAVSPDYAHDELLLAVGAGDGQLYVSDDGGDNWTAGALTLGSGGQHTLHFSPTFAADRIVLAASSTDPGVYRSVDGGATWSPVGWYDPDHAYHGGFVGGSVFALALSPNTAYDAAAFAGASSGIYRSNSRGEYWYQNNTGLAPLTVRALAVAPGEPGRLLAGASFFEHLRFDTGAPGEYDGNLQLSTDGGRTWRDVSGRLDRVQRVVFSPAFAADQTVFAAAGALGQHGFYDGGVYRSTDGGQNWQEVLSDRICRALALSPGFATDRTLWVSTATASLDLGVSVSTDGGDTWTPLAPSVPAQIIVPSPNYAVDRTLFAGTQQGLQRSTNAGASWTRVLTPAVTALAVSPAYGASRTLYAAVQESVSVPGALYRSTDGGATWQRAAATIPSTWEGNALRIAALSFAADGSVLAGVFYGVEKGGGAVYRSIDGGQTWQALGGELSAYNVFALATAPGRPLTFYSGADGGLWALELFQGGPAEPGQWEIHGPRGGMAQALAVSPAFEHDGLALSGEWRAGRYGDQSGLGVFKSNDSGQTWQSSASGAEAVQYSSAVHAFAFSPAFASDQTVFAATWGGLFKSTDGGESWQWLGRLYAGAPGAITAVAVAPDYAASGHVLAGGGWGGLFVSRDGGINWTRHNAVSANSAIVYSPGFALDEVAFAGGNNLYRTADGGAQWTQVLTQSVSALAISPQFVADRTIFAGGYAGLYISTDGGTGWISVTLPSGLPGVNALAISPAFAADRTLFAGNNGGLYRSGDAGLSWQPVAGYPGQAVLSLALAPRWPAQPVLLVGAAAGVYRTTDGGATWTQARGMANLSVSPLAFSAAGNLLIAGAQNHGVYGSYDDGLTWLPMGLHYQNPFRLAISPAYAADRTMLAAVGAGAGLGLYRTTDSGQTWASIGSTDYPGGALAFSPQYTSDRTIYFTGAHGQVLRSTDGGATRTPLGAWPPGTYGGHADRVALPPNYPADSTVLAAGAQGFWRLPPGATTWQLAATGLISDISVTFFAVSPAYAVDKTLLATAYWYPGSNGAFHYDYGVWRSADGGLNWQRADAGLPNVAAGQVIFSASYASDRTAYLVAGEQLYRSLDGGSSWTAVGAPPGKPGLGGLALSRSGDALLASGVGVWRYHTLAQDTVINGGFEAGSGWELPATAHPAGYAERVAYDGARAMRIGLDAGSNVYAYSSARQAVAVPADALSATLRCRVYPVSGEAALAAQGQAFPQGRVADEFPQAGALAGDAQYLLLVEPGSGAILQTLFWELSNAQGWRDNVFDLLPYAGQTVVLHFGVYNDGGGGKTGMYVDDVSLVIARPKSSGAACRQYLPLILKNYQ